MIFRQELNHNIDSFSIIKKSLIMKLGLNEILTEKT